MAAITWQWPRCPSKSRRPFTHYAMEERGKARWAKHDVRA
eukprot:CAMPEP_0182868640 /NCGR_PEP_ID=MMETSP0034_2-20130328/9443_1 /TAXON_ID=156128 /ORGANISM="Nephroselmis pyriformis, Strain CCMP717" /LENGTH=39 /DNA_ID= /DNA_START= /DNA_END= /DNA_ORIENTATION=